MNNIGSTPQANKLAPTSSAPRAATALLPSGQASQDFFVADLNGDGTADLVQIGPSSLTVTLRNSDATILSKATYPVGPNASSGLAADFNGDGKLDLAITNEARTPTFGGATSGTVSILLGNGEGTFQAAVSYPVDGQPDSLAAADFNGDGKMDLAVVGFSLSPNAVSVLLGAGNGTFGRATTFNVGSGPYSIIAADFNNDGLPDLATEISAQRTCPFSWGRGMGRFNRYAEGLPRLCGPQSRWKHGSGDCRSFFQHAGSDAR